MSGILLLLGNTVEPGHHGQECSTLQSKVIFLYLSYTTQPGLCGQVCSTLQLREILLHLGNTVQPCSLDSVARNVAHCNQRGYCYTCGYTTQPGLFGQECSTLRLRGKMLVYCYTRVRLYSLDSVDRKALCSPGDIATTVIQR